MSEEIDPWITVVSGLPRSGTSLAMQMLQRGGMPLLTDGERTADEDNPRGYWEYEEVKRLAQGCAWIAEARGHAVKVISHLVEYLPVSERYRVVRVQRDMDEVLASQAKMISRLNRPAPDPAIVRRAFETHMQSFEDSMSTRKDSVMLTVEYGKIITTPGEIAREIATFIQDHEGPILDINAMADAVDQNLYRNRNC